MSVPGPLDITSEFSLLSAEQQQLVVAYMRRLQSDDASPTKGKPSFKQKPLPEGTPLGEYQKFAGTISKEDIALMEKPSRKGANKST